MRQGANADHVLGQNSDGLSGQSGLHDFENVGRKMGEVRQSLVFDLPVFAIGPAEKGCGVDLLSDHSLCCDHMTGSASARHRTIITEKNNLVKEISDYICRLNISLILLQIKNKNSFLGVILAGTLG
jgi:hypothetical protein